MSNRLSYLSYSCGLVAAMTMVACSNNKGSSNSNSVNAAGVVADSTLTPAQKADRLAQASEQLLSAQGFAYAGDVADLALQQDPANIRAQLIKAVLAPIMAQKGILARVEPLFEKNPQVKDGYDKQVADIQTQSPNSTLKTFLFDGSPDIQSEADAQNFLTSVSDGFETLRQFAKKNKDSQLTIMTSDGLYQAMQQRFQEACQVVQTAPWQYDTKCPSPINLLEVSLSRADFEGIEEMAAGMELYLLAYNSYDLSGSIQVAQANAKQQPSPKQVIDQLTKDPGFGKLRANNAFAKINELGADAISGVRWVMNNQNSLCPIGTDDPHNRLGALFSHGICVPKESTSDIALALSKASSALGGRKVQVTFGDSLVTQILPSATINSPIADLHSLAPLSYDLCGNVNGVADVTLGGLFPNGDFNSVLLQEDQCGR